MIASAIVLWENFFYNGKKVTKKPTMGERLLSLDDKVGGLLRWVKALGIHPPNFDEDQSIAWENKENGTAGDGFELGGNSNNQSTYNIRVGLVQSTPNIQGALYTKDTNIKVTQGTSEFKPTPSENRDCFKNSYNISHTLLVKFNSDAIDETDIVEEILKPRMKSIGGTLKKVSLSGNHLTPCIQDLRWQVGYTYTPADALVQGIKALSLNDTRVLAKTVAEWFKSLGD
ncbi:hypothetical protein GIB67_009678 [Kingdonia uniflora]|uniref:Uncharacterized protein n=1 Tax=Kingdonia uniflora TaxID=39325 RepID=A0A7J7LAY4_9MAGN|nr:hypothetical protein GIB67_009678 [Kingdonia uniflora]